MNSEHSDFPDGITQDSKVLDYLSASIAATPELVFKMSKKIAQLTKVIYLVNLKNDLHQTEMDDLAQKYENQISQKCLDYQVAVSEMEKVTQNLKAEHRLNITEIQKDFELKSVEMDRKLLELEENYKIQFENSNRNQQKYSIRAALKIETLEKLLNQTQMEKAEAQSRLDLKMKEYASLELNFKNMSKTWDGEKYLLKKKQEAMETVHNERISESIAAHQKEMDLLRAKFDAELLASQRIISNLESTLSRETKSSSTIIENLKLKNAEQKQNFEKLHDEHRTLKQTLMRLQEEKLHLQADSRSNAEQLRARIRVVEAEAAEHDAKYLAQKTEKEILANELKKRTEDFHAQLADQKQSMLQESSQALTNSIRNFELKVEELKQRNDNLVIQFTNSKQGLEKELWIKKIECQTLASKLLCLERDSLAREKDKEHEITDLKQQLDEQRLLLSKNHTAELQKLERASKQACEDLIFQKNSLEEKLCKLYKEKKEANVLFTKNIGELQLSLEQHKAVWEKEREQLFNTFQEQSSVLHLKSKEKESIIRSMEQALASSKVSEENLSKELDLALEKIKATDASIRELTQNECINQAQIAKLRSQVDTLNEIQLKLRDECEKDVSKFKELQSELETRTSEYYKVFEAANVLEQAKAQLESQFQALSSELHLKTEEFTELQQKIQEEKKAIDQKNSDLQARLAFMTQKLLEAENSQALLKDNMDVALKESTESNHRRIQSLEDHIQNLEASMLQEKQEYSKVLTRLRTEKEKEITENRKELINEIEKIRNDCSKEVQASQAMVEQLKSKLQKEMENSHRSEELVRSLECRMSEFSLEHEKEVNCMKEKFKADAMNSNQLQLQLLEKMKKEHLSTIQGMLAEFEEAQIFMKKELEKQTENLRNSEIRYANREAREVDLARIHDLEAEIARLNRKNNQIMEELNRSRREVLYREESLNRLFHTKPNVGIMNPLSKKASSTNTLSGSTPSLRANPSPLPPLANQGKGSDDSMNAKPRERSTGSTRKPKN